MPFKNILVIFLMLFSVNSYAAEPERPTEEEAAAALGALLNLPAAILKDATVKLGTCIPVENASHKGQIACTAALMVGAGSSETQADFYRDPKQADRWAAQPSQSQDQLPFPDPKLY